MAMQKSLHVSRSDDALSCTLNRPITGIGRDERGVVRPSGASEGSLPTMPFRIGSASGDRESNLMRPPSTVDVSPFASSSSAATATTSGVVGVAAAGGQWARVRLKSERRCHYAHNRTGPRSTCGRNKII